MRCHNTVLLAWILVAVASSPVLAQSDPHAAHAEHAAHAQPMQAASEAKPAEGSLWATDAPLRQGMRHLREATMILEHYEMGHLDDTQRDSAVSKIDAAIADMFANCKLDDQADAALHELLAKFMAGAKAARDGAFTKVELGAMQDALTRYPTLFDDADWSAGGD